MTDKKKNNNEETADKTVIKNEEITDDQANKASGGASGSRYVCFICNRQKYGSPCVVIDGRAYCAGCAPKNTIA